VFALNGDCELIGKEYRAGWRNTPTAAAPSAPLADRMGRLIRIKAKPNL
jgi:hypothetical protein